MEKATEFLQKFNEWIQDATLFSYIFKWISGAWIKGLYKLASGIEGIIDQVFKVFGFLDNDTIGTIYKGMRILSLTVLIIMIIVLAYKYILNERVDLKSGLFRAVLFMCLGVQLPGMITSAVELSQTIYGETKSLDTKDNKEQKTLSYSIVKENLTDLQYISQKGFSTLTNEAGAKRNNLAEDVFLATDLTQVITPDSLGTMKKDANSEDDVSYLEYKLVTAPDGKLTSEKIESGGIFNFFQEGKFRFQYHTGTITISLITVSFAFICSAFIIASSLIELVFAKLMFPVLSVSDIETGQRTKKVLLDMGISLLSIMLTGFSLSIFKLYFSYVGSLRLSFVPYFILCIVGARIVIDGPKFFGKFLGLDIGVRSGWQAMLGTAIAAKTVSSGTSSAVKGSKKAVKTIGEHVEKFADRIRVNNGVHEGNNNDKSIQNRTSASGSNGGSRTGLQDLATNFQQPFGMQDQQESMAETSGINQSTVTESQQIPTIQEKEQVSSIDGIDPKSTLNQSEVGKIDPNAFNNTGNIKSSTVTPISAETKGSNNEKSIRNVPTGALNRLGEKDSRINSPIDPRSTADKSGIGGIEANAHNVTSNVKGSTATPRNTEKKANTNEKSIRNLSTGALKQMGEKGSPINQNRANNLVSDKTDAEQTVQGTTIPPLKTPSEKSTIKTAVEKGDPADHTQQLKNPTVSEGVSSTSDQRTKDQEVKPHAPETVSITSTSAIVRKNSQSSADTGNKTVYQSPQKSLDRSITTPNKQNVPETPSGKQTSQKATAPNYHVSTVESNTSDPSSPEEMAHKMLTESSVKPDNPYYDIYQSMDKVKAEDFI